MPQSLFLKMLAVALASIGASAAGHIQPRQWHGYHPNPNPNPPGINRHQTTTTTTTDANPTPVQSGGGGDSGTSTAAAPVSTSGDGGGGGGGCSGCSSSQYSISFSGSFSYEASGNWGSSGPATGCQQSSGSMCFCLDGGTGNQNPGMVVWAAGGCEAKGTKFEINVFSDPSTSNQNTLDISITDAYSIPMTCTHGSQSVGGVLSGSCPDQESGYCNNANGHEYGPACSKPLPANPVASYFRSANYWSWDCDYVAVNWETQGGVISCSVGGSSGKEKRAEHDAMDLVTRDELDEPTELQARDQAEPFKLGGGILDVAKRHTRKLRPHRVPIGHIGKM